MGRRRNRWEYRDIPYRPPRQMHDAVLAAPDFTERGVSRKKPDEGGRW